ncbi:MAG: cation diffusion facilitator family transporter [Actinomycetota bacterium]
MSGERSHGHGHGGHTHASASDLLQEGSAAGIRALRISALGLLLTSTIQFTVVAIGGSVALMADALHNFGDVLTSIVLWVALIATRRAADHRYTFGYQRFEDLAGLAVVLAIFASAAIAAYEAITHMVHNSVPTHLVLGMAAGGVGFFGNEIVAKIKVRQGRKIGSAALVAEGQHSRIDGLASLAAVAGLGGVMAGADWADPVAGLLLVAVILAVGVQSARPIVATLLDRVEPDLVHQIEEAVTKVDGVDGVHEIRARWAGRALYVALNVSLPGDVTLEAAHQRCEEARHAVLHAFPEVVQVDVHADPSGEDHARYHEETAHHFGR